MLGKNETHMTQQTVMASQQVDRRVALYIPIVGMVVTISPSFSLYRIVVFPAASRPTMRILISFFPKSPLNSLPKIPPIFQS